MPREIVQERDVALVPAPSRERHHGGMIRYVFNKDTVESKQLRLMLQEYAPGGFTVAEEHGVHYNMEPRITSSKVRWSSNWAARRTGSDPAPSCTSDLGPPLASQPRSTDLALPDLQLRLGGSNERRRVRPQWCGEYSIRC